MRLHSCLSETLPFCGTNQNSEKPPELATEANTETKTQNLFPRDAEDASGVEADEMKQQGTRINAANLQESLECAANASQVGQSQFFTPLEVGAALAKLLPDARPTITDFTCGAGHLLVAAQNKSTRHLLGCDIEAVRNIPHEGKASMSRIVGDITKVAQLLDEVNWSHDLSVLNPPFSLHLWKENLAFLGESTIDAAQAAFHAVEPRLGKDKIDSTIATIALALHFHATRGESFLIANNATLERLVFAPGAVYRCLAKHIWAHLVFDGNLMTGRDDANFEKEEQFRTGIIYFARTHHEGVRLRREFDSIAQFEAEHKAGKFDLARFEHRGMSISTEYQCNMDTVELWSAVRDEWRDRTQQSRHPNFNIWLDREGNVKTNLSLYEQKSPKIDKKLAEKLFTLNGHNPMSLVMQAEQREALKWAVTSGIWKVDPKLPELVEAAIRDYDSVRAPLQPLPPIQAMGYLDEEKWIECKTTLEHPDHGVLFVVGKRYELTTRTVLVERVTHKPTLSYGMDEILLNGQELLIEIKDEKGEMRQFLDSRHLSQGVKVGENMDREKFLTLQDLAAHFKIPIVRDVADANPDQFRANIETLRKIEDVINDLRGTGNGKRWKFKKFQIDDLARAALHDGLIPAWATGLGKTIFAFIWPLLKCGVDWNRGLYPLAPCLLIAPEHLHQQIKNEAWDIFRIKVTTFATQEDYYAMAPLKPGFYISSYTQISGNGVKEAPDPYRAGFTLPEDDSVHFGEKDLDHLAECMATYGVTVKDAKAHKFEGTVAEKFSDLVRVRELCAIHRRSWMENVGVEKNGFKCIYSPSLSDLCRNDFATVMLDEAVRIKGDDTLIGTGVRQMNPKYRAALTATPIKNRLGDIFHIAHWVTGGHKDATPRWPYPDNEDSKNDFMAEFLVQERNLSKEKAENNGHIKSRYSKGKLRRGKATAEVCNIHRLWKLLAPIVLRRRKQDVGEDIVPKVKQPIRVPMGTKQAKVYEYHLGADYKDSKGQPSLVMKLTALRSAAAAPHSHLLHRVDDEDGTFRSDSDYIPKMAAALNVIEQIIRRGESVALFSALTEPLDTLSRRLTEAGIPHDLMDGRSNQKVRGAKGVEFAKGRAAGGKPVALAGLKAMAEGQNWYRINNAILIAFDWAYDLFEQGINRVHRMNSENPVNIYPIICEGTIDRKLEALIDEKGNACELVLDGQLLGESTKEVNLAELLRVAESEFADIKTYDEDKLEKDWPTLRAKLQDAWMESERAFGRGVAVTPQRRVVSLPEPAPVAQVLRPSAELMARIRAGRGALAVAA